MTMSLPDCKSISNVSAGTGLSSSIIRRWVAQDLIASIAKPLRESSIICLSITIIWHGTGFLNSSRLLTIAAGKYQLPFGIQISTFVSFSIVFYIRIKLSHLYKRHCSLFLVHKVQSSYNFSINQSKWWYCSILLFFVYSLYYRLEE